MPRLLAPSCGTVYWDVPRTARGVWFAPGVPERPEDPHLTLAYYNMDGQQGAFAMGNSFVSTNKTYLFTPAASPSTVNTPFEQVTAGSGVVHCYQDLREQYSREDPGAVFLLTVGADDQLKIEVKPGLRECPPVDARTFGPAALTFAR
jgi:hypothetical protein